MSTRTWARQLVVLLGALVFLASISLAPARAAESPLPGSFLGAAWGNKGNVQAGEISTRLGRAAYQPCPCRGTNGKVSSNSVHNVDAGDAYRAGHIVSTAQAQKQSGKRAFAQTTSRIVDVRALGGLIRAQAIEAVATVRATTSSILANTDGSGIVGLRIGGVAVQAKPGARINLPGFGYVMVYEVSRFGNGTSLGGVQVNMLRIVISRENDLDIPVGSEIIVGHARVGYSRNETRAILSAAAWGSQANAKVADIENRLGRSAAVYMGCHTKGITKGSNRVDSTTVPGILTTHVVLSQVYGSASPTVATARATSNIENVDLLDGVLTADVIRGVSTATVAGSGGSTSFEGSKFVNVRVLGVAIGDNVAPNTKLTIADLGELTLYATEASSDADEAQASLYMVILRVTLANTLGLPVGTEIRLGRARASAEP